MKPILLFFAAVVLLGPARSAPKDDSLLAGLEAGQSMGERIARIDRFVHEHYYDPQGLMYSHIKWDEERPFRAEDFGPGDSVMMGPEPHQWMSYENSPFVAGLFLAAQSFRFEATKDPEALVYARRAYGAVEANYRLSETPSADTGPVQRLGSLKYRPRLVPPRAASSASPTTARLQTIRVRSSISARCSGFITIGSLRHLRSANGSARSSALSRAAGAQVTASIISEKLGTLRNPTRARSGTCSCGQ